MKSTIGPVAQVAVTLGGIAIVATCLATSVAEATPVAKARCLPARIKAIPVRVQERALQASRWCSALSGCEDPMLR